MTIEEDIQITAVIHPSGVVELASFATIKTITNRFFLNSKYYMSKTTRHLNIERTLEVIQENKAGKIK